MMIAAFLMLLLADAGASRAIESPTISQVEITDQFWAPKRTIWRHTTIPDCFNKFEKTGAFANFDRVRRGETGGHEGPPWYDGLIYEMIRAAADFLRAQPDPALETRIDAYIEKIAAAAAKDPNGYIATFTTLMEPDHRWGMNGGYERWQHDLYNAGALMEAGAHYFDATGKTPLLKTAVRMANFMCEMMGPPPRRNLVPSHPLAEEAAVHLFCLFRDNPALKAQIGVPVDERRFLQLAEFWLEARGHHGGQPDWEKMNEKDCQKFIREVRYDGDRPSWGAYAQDHKPLLAQESIEGHAVRATLVCAGLAAAAAINERPDYAEAAQRLWTNMTTRKMHITGGVGAFAADEKFGPEYVLPNDAYLETCAAVGAGFFHHNMFLLCKHSQYIDELERALYNSILSGISLKGDSYFYENPLKAVNRARWDWHGCPCCPPMFLKIMAAMPRYLYACENDNLYINLFVASRFNTAFNGQPVIVTQQTKYPWDGKVDLALEMDAPVPFALHIRVPAWSAAFSFAVNGEMLENTPVEQGYAILRRTWNPGDHVSFEIPLPVRLVYAHPKVEADAGRAALMRGPLVYCVESAGNAVPVSRIVLSPTAQFNVEFQPDVLGGIAVVTGKSAVPKDRPDMPLYQDLPPDTTLENFTAIPFYANSNREPGEMAVWLPVFTASGASIQ